MGTAKETILIVEDSTDLRECFSECLTDEGYDVTIAAHGQEGLDYLEQSPNKPSLILLDYMMPIMNAREFRKQQLASSKIKDIPTVILSAAKIPHETLKSMAASAILQKPIDIDSLLEEVKKHLVNRDEV